MTNAYDRYKAVDAELDLLHMHITRLRLKEDALIAEKGALWWKMFPAEREEADNYFLSKVQALSEVAGEAADEYACLFGSDQKNLN